MTNSEKLALENGHLRNQIKELEKELEYRDEVHLRDLTVMRDQLKAIMNKYCLN